MGGVTGQSGFAPVIQEVGPRDGFQIVKQFIPTEIKLETIDRLVKAGLSKIQVTSFVSPKAIPQMSDASEVARACVERYPGTMIFALVPNLRGAQNAVNAGLREVAVVLSLSESHNKANVGKSVDESLEEIKRIRHTFPELKIMQDIATTFSCPFEGRMEIPPLVELIGKLSDIGIGEFTLCDTIGTAYPKQVEEVFDTVRTAFPDAVFNVHIHDTRNMGMLNSYVAIKHGARGVQSSLGGLGGCPFAPGASGNTATEDLVYMLHAEGFDTGVNFDLLLDAARFLRKHVAGNYSGHQVMIEK
jgi:hydroxymethylglutaryl-CoA lyase